MVGKARQVGGEALPRQEAGVEDERFLADVISGNAMRDTDVPCVIAAAAHGREIPASSG